MLPPPYENGIGTFNSHSGDGVESNRLAWQEENVIYEMYMSDALELIDVVTGGFD